MVIAALPSGFKTSASSATKADIGKNPFAAFSIALSAGIRSSASLNMLAMQPSALHDRRSHDSAGDRSPMPHALRRRQQRCRGSSYRLCHPHVVVMKAAQERYWNDTADGLNGPAHRCVLPKGEMCANPIIVDGISRQDPAQMRL